MEGGEVNEDGNKRNEKKSTKCGEEMRRNEGNEEKRNNLARKRKLVALRCIKRKDLFRVIISSLINLLYQLSNYLTLHSPLIIIIAST